ncbi:MAG TPA: carboxypeptidase-like regulatory domain-containing protein [Hymenobacter sp.]|jgi:hypothetical protein|uniref:carboxypeptidase-like regulatory domain-containing protein n=1 Tax=Hymenobacter sp. TaxID=1898978 RepID=UPI002ED80582
MKQSYLLLVGALVATSCGKSDKEDPKPTPSFTGTIKLADEFGAAQANRSGVLVTVTDVSPQVTTQTAADGTFTLSGVPAGNHQISYTKTGYGTYWWTYVPTSGSGGAVLPEVTLGQVSTSLVTVRVTKVGNQFQINGTVSPTPTTSQPRYYRIYLQNYDLPAPPPIASAYALTLGGPTQADGTFTELVSQTQLSDAGLTSAQGANVRVRATGDNPVATTYDDGSSGKKVYPAANLLANTRSVIFNSK